VGLLNSRRISDFKFPSRKRSAFESFVRAEFGVRPIQKAWYDEAMTHASLSADLGPNQIANERLEFLGDAVLGAIVAKRVFDEFPQDDEGPLTQRKARLVSRKALNQIGESMGLGAFIRVKMGRSKIPATVIGNALEALIGAIYIDHGYRKTERAVLRMFERHQLSNGEFFATDFKSRVQEWAQQSAKSVEYSLLGESMVEGRNSYEMELLIGGQSMGKGVGSSKKGAEQAAAEAASRNIPL
jgi:ribonuclease III